MSTCVEDDMRERIVEFLPGALAKALRKYNEILDQTLPENSKDIKAHYEGCKAAVAHIELITSLARWADLPGGKNQDNKLAIILSEAQQELDKYEESPLDDE